MSTRFLPLKLENDNLFGIELQGIVGRSDRERLQELADKCLAKKKNRVVLDLSGLKSIGGLGAGIMADFQRRLVEAGGEAVFAGAGDTVQHFLNQRFEDLPLRFFDTIADAEHEFHEETGGQEIEKAGKVDAVEKVESRPVKTDRKVEVARKQPAAELEADINPPAEDEVEELPTAEVGAVSFFDEDEETTAEGGLDNLLDEFTGKQTSSGRRKDHQYLSLTDAIESLDGWHEGRDSREFGQALNNLLYSHGLAEDVLFMVRRDDLLIAEDRAWELAGSGGLASQLAAIARPTTLLDVSDDNLDETELTFLETVEPDMILPVVRDGRLEAAVFLKRNNNEHDYSVGENFAFELLIKVMSEVREEPAEAKSGEKDEVLEKPSEDLEEVLLQLALELPETDDGRHFWLRLVRRTDAVLGLTDLAFLAPGRHEPLVVLGREESLERLDLSNERLQLFFRTIERPIQVENMPVFFQDVRDDLLAGRIAWIVPLKWDGSFQGTVLLDISDRFAHDEAVERIEQIFSPVARIMTRIAGDTNTADSSLDLVRVLIGQREKRCFGSDKVTEAIVEQVHVLGREMGFTPDQERALIYGCLLRDLGLIALNDTMMKTPESLTRAQWEIYRDHPLTGAQLLKELDLPASILEVVECHHERFNGEGYPRGLSGRDIPLTARVVAVVENYVKMITGASGKTPLEPDEAASIMRSNSDKRFDPDIVSVFLQAILSANKEQVLEPV